MPVLPGNAVSLAVDKGRRAQSPPPSPAEYGTANAAFDNEGRKGGCPRSFFEVLPRSRRGVSPSLSTNLATAARSDIGKSSSQSSNCREWTFSRTSPNDSDDKDNKDEATTLPYPSRPLPSANTLWPSRSSIITGSRL